MAAIVVGTVLFVWRHFRFYPTRLEKRSRECESETERPQLFLFPSRSHCSFIRAAPQLIEVHKQRERKRAPFELHSKPKACWARQWEREERAKVQMPPHTHFLLPHTFHWKNIYTKAKAVNPLQICEKKTEMKWKLIPTHGLKSAAQIFGRWLCVFRSVCQNVSLVFVSFPHRFFFFFCFFPCGIYWQPASKREGELGCVQGRWSATACLWKTHDFCVQQFLGHGEERKAKECEKLLLHHSLQKTVIIYGCSKMIIFTNCIYTGL